MSKENLIVGHHYPAFDGLRGIAVLLVLWFHSSNFSYELNPDSYYGITEIYYYFTIIGTTGVDLFFVLSGFLITGILIDTSHHKHILKKFYIRRSLRIFPLYYAVFFIFLAYFIFMLGFNNIDNWKIFTHLFYIQNWSLEYNSDVFMMLNHTWSLAVEEQFYLFWPLLFLFFYEKGQGVKQAIYLCLFMICLSWILRLYFMDLNRPKFAYTYTISRLDGLALGALLSISCAHYRKLLVKYRHLFLVAMGFLLSLLLIVLFSNDIGNGKHDEMTRIGLMICTTLYTCLLAYIFLSDDTNLIKRCLSSNWIGRIGKYSYGIYIFHFTVMFILGNNLFEYELSYWESHLVLLIVGGLISFLLSWLSYKYFEKPILCLKDKYAPLN